MYRHLRSASPEVYVALLWFLWLTRVRTLAGHRLPGAFLGILGLTIWLPLGDALSLVGISVSVLVTTAVGTPFVLLGAYYVVADGRDTREEREEEIAFAECRGP